MRKQLSAVAVAVGVGFVGLSFIGKDGGRDWTAEQAQNYSEAAADLHRLTYEAAQVREAAGKAASTPGTLKDNSGKLPADAPMPPDPLTATPQRAEAALAAAKKRYDTARAALDDARDHGHSGATVMRWLGIGIAIAGICVLASGRSAGDRPRQ
jgi:hypothetical protein